MSINHFAASEVFVKLWKFHLLLRCTLLAWLALAVIAVLAPEGGRSSKRLHPPSILTACPGLDMLIPQLLSLEKRQRRVALLALLAHNRRTCGATAHARESHAVVVRQCSSDIRSEEHQCQRNALRNHHPGLRSKGARRSSQATLRSQSSPGVRSPLVPDVRVHRDHQVVHDSMGDGGLDLWLDGLVVGLVHPLLLDHLHGLTASRHNGGDAGEEAQREEVVRRSGEVVRREELGGDVGREEGGIAERVQDVEGGGEEDERDREVDRRWVDWSIVPLECRLLIQDGRTHLAIVALFLGNCLEGRVHRVLSLAGEEAERRRDTESRRNKTKPRLPFYSRPSSWAVAVLTCASNFHKLRT